MKFIIFLFLTGSLFANITISKENLDPSGSSTNIDVFLEEDKNFKDMKHHNELSTISKEIREMTKEEMIELINKAYKKGYKNGHEIAIKNMRDKITKLEKHLDHLFNFQSLYLEGKLLPPKISIVKSDVEVTKDGKIMILNQEHLQIVEPAKFVDKIDNWKNIIW